jgi:hypothetical protein
MSTNFLDKWRIGNDTRRTMGVHGEESDGEGVQAEETTGSVRGTKGPNDVDRRIYAATYRNKHKEEINARRREQEQEPLGAYKKARRRAKYKHQAWDISFDNWFNVWNSCPKVFDDSVDVYRHAWTMRSGNLQEGTQMRRLDTNKGWQVGNVAIYYRNQRIPEHGIVAPWDFLNEKPAYEVDDNWINAIKRIK